MFTDFEVALKAATDAIENLRVEAEAIKDRMESIIEACETLEDEV